MCKQAKFECGCSLHCVWPNQAQETFLFTTHRELLLLTCYFRLRTLCTKRQIQLMYDLIIIFMQIRIVILIHVPQNIRIISTMTDGRPRFPCCFSSGPKPRIHSYRMRSRQSAWMSSDTDALGFQNIRWKKDLRQNGPQCISLYHRMFVFHKSANAALKNK